MTTEENFDLYTQNIVSEIETECRKHLKKIKKELKKSDFVKFEIKRAKKTVKTFRDYYLWFFNEGVRVAKLGTSGPVFEKSISTEKAKMEKHKREVIAMHEDAIKKLEEYLGNLSPDDLKDLGKV